MLARTYLTHTQELIGRLIEQQASAIEQAAEMIAQAIAAGHSLFGFGCNHSLLPVLDIYYRAGGLMLVNPIMAPGLTLDLHPPTLTSRMEQLDGYAQIALGGAPIRAGDVVIIVSVSGRNAVPVEAAAYVKSLGASVIGITSRTFTESVTPRNKLGKKLIDLADMVIDNLAPPGDAILSIEGLPEKFTPVSGVTSVAILHALMAETIERLIARGITPPVYWSGNVDGGAAHNERLLAENAGRIFYL
ncbi:MAG: SIS domain-containing protein [Anaerolineae bacterium]|nr:SIS domain-containing protein [Thermoflexales bacterium]MDW8408389.1 SIS domain-containing protein [Anaerolineae bacterium]